MDDRTLLRDLAKRVAAIAADEANEKRRNRWRRHNELVGDAGGPDDTVGVPIYIRAVADREIIVPMLECVDPFYRPVEQHLRRMIFQSTLDDDYVIEPWVTIEAAKHLPPEGGWGVRLGRAEENRESGAFTIDAPLKELSDVSKLVVPKHAIDEERTKRNTEKMADAIGDIIEINVSRKPFWTNWHGDLSTDLGYFRGIEQMLWDMADEPEKLKELLAFMRDGVLKSHEEADAAGDWRLGDHENQSMPYAASLASPRANSAPVKQRELWGFIASQETGVVSPEMFEEFMVSFQKPIAERFAMVSYGCCEDLSRKIGVLRKIRNLRRIAVSPFADVARSAEEIGNDYICSWRPSPADMVAYGFDEARVRSIVGSAQSIFRANGSVFDVCLKDVETVQHEPERIGRFVRTVREVTATESFRIREGSPGGRR
jgi:hypothetical protein